MALEISSPEELEAWLKGKPRRWEQIIALRSAMRASLVSFDPEIWKEGQANSDLLVELFRANAVIWGAHSVATAAGGGDVVDLVHRILSTQPLLAAIDKTNLRPNAVPLIDASYAVAQSIATHSLRPNNEEPNAHGPADQAGAFKYHSLSSEVWEQVSNDCDLLDEGMSPFDLLNSSLWFSSIPKIRDIWARAAGEFSRPEHGFEIWREWYFGRLEGLPHAFADFTSKADEKFYRWIITHNDEWWSRAPLEVNSEIAKFVDDLRSGKPPKPWFSPDGQSDRAPSFTIGSSGQLAFDEDARPQGLEGHSSLEPLRATAQSRVARLGDLLQNSNSAPSFSPICIRLLDALGQEWNDIQPFALILEAQSLRKAWDIQQSFGPMDAGLPLEGEDLQVADDAISALNLLIGSVEYLENIETKRLGPDYVAPLSTPENLVDVADALLQDEVTEEQADHLIRLAAENAPEIPDNEDRRTSLAVRLGLNLVRVSINLFAKHEKELIGALAGGSAVGVAVADLMTTGGVLAAGSGLAWALAKNINKNREKWRAIAKSADVTEENFEKLLERLDKLPLD